MVNCRMFTPTNFNVLSVSKSPTPSTANYRKIINLIGARNFQGNFNDIQAGTVDIK